MLTSRFPAHDPDPVQLLDPAGRRVAHPDHELDLTPEEYRALYRDMVLVRRIDTEATVLQRQGELGLWASLLGQEAAQIGAGRALRPQDFVFSSYREHGVAWCRGIPPIDLLGFWRGTAHGSWDPYRAGMANYQVVVGGHALHGVGYGMGLRLDGADGAVLVCFGDGATSQGDVHEAFTYAAVFDAPVVFYCQNNHWAISEPLSRQTRVPLYRRAHGYGFPGVRVDGNDVLATLAVTDAALEHARSGSGPVLIEAVTYRMAPHTTSDDATRYRSPDEVAEWAARDPITRLRAYLEHERFADPAFFTALDEEADRLAVRLRTECRALPDPGPTAVFDHVYAGPHPLIDAGRARLTEFLDQFTDGPEGTRTWS
ncbi:pyruvate dehydrogenase (acetyl-transferring) E1 component subunit alpha [Kitasatospora sp. NPDC059408]|uniref:pyruvate dehydrogenase (acetyl-transferring) E1 component subunit alpha n=1 Tax=Kitasatospora sp. NPDC059408 TaxID=3346823 RepID=UPI0036D1F8E8